jgi:hypothetical protein
MSYWQRSVKRGLKTKNKHRQIPTVSLDINFRAIMPARTFGAVAQRLLDHNSMLQIYTVWRNGRQSQTKTSALCPTEAHHIFSIGGFIKRNPPVAVEDLKISAFWIPWEARKIEHACRFKFRHVKSMSTKSR